MKSALGMIFLLFVGMCYAQDPANLAKYELILKDKSTIAIVVNKVTKAKELVLQTNSQNCTLEKGMSLTFSDDMDFRFHDQIVKCERVDKDEFTLSTSMILSDAMYEKFAKTDLISFTLGNKKIPIDFQEGESLIKLIPFINEESK